MNLCALLVLGVAFGVEGNGVPRSTPHRPPEGGHIPRLSPAGCAAAAARCSLVFQPQDSSQWNGLECRRNIQNPVEHISMRWDGRNDLARANHSMSYQTRVHSFADTGGDGAHATVDLAAACRCSAPPAIRTGERRGFLSYATRLEVIIVLTVIPIYISSTLICMKLFFEHISQNHVDVALRGIGIIIVHATILIVFFITIFRMLYDLLYRHRMHVYEDFWALFQHVFGDSGGRSMFGVDCTVLTHHCSNYFPVLALLADFACILRRGFN